ncbi:MAG: hypothetical protein PHS99_09150 [Candidatus Marinimicrobia bacterium]|nr:hypothetical protein [Candidatus Neomarinimicrobiota bacterium]
MKILYNQAMQIEQSEVLRACPYERTETQLSHASGFNPKGFIGTLISRN